MKKNYTLFTALVLLFSLNAISQNLMPDPNFSENPTDYVFTAGNGDDGGSSGSLDLTVDHTGDGSYSYKLAATAGKQNHMKYSLSNITAGEHTLSFWIKGTENDKVNFHINNNGAAIWPNGEDSSSAFQEKIAVTGTWQQVTKTITVAVAGSAIVKVFNKTANSIIHIDDIVLERVPVVATERLDFDFNDTSDAEGFTSKNGVVLSQPTAGEIMLAIDDTNKFPKFEQSSGLYSVDADSYKEVQITLINASPKNKVTFVTIGSQNEFFTESIVTDAVNPQIITINLTGSSNWAGDQSSWFLQLKEDDGGTVVPSAGTINIQQILFQAASTAGINDIGFKNDASISLYPNPVNDVFKVNSQRTIKKLEVYNLLGQQQKIQSLDEDSMDVSSLAKGVYIVKIYQEDNIISTKKIVKK